MELSNGAPLGDKSSIARLLVEFKDLNEQRIRNVNQDINATKDERLQKKVNFLQTYVNDLTDQIQVLLQAVEDLQRDAGCTGANVGMEQRTSDGIVDVNEMNRRTMVLDEFVGPAALLPHSSASLIQIRSELKDLKVQLQTKDTIILDLEREHRESLQQNKKVQAESQVLEQSERLVHVQSELVCLQRIQKDNIKEIAEKDICITKLGANIQLLQEEQSDTQAQLTRLTVRVRELQEELKRKEEELVQKKDKLRRKCEKELQEAEERRNQEQQNREQEEKKIEEEWMRMIGEERQAHGHAVKKWAEMEAVLKAEMKVSRKQAERQGRELSQLHQKEETFLSEREEHVRNLDQDVVGLRVTQDSLRRALAMKEKHAKQLVWDNQQLRESLASLQSKLQTDECMLRDTIETRDQTKTSLQTERQQKQQIQDQLQHANTEMERLQQELTHMHHTAAKKMQKSDIKMCALVKELMESKRQHSECQKELLRREKTSEILCVERDELRAKMDDRSRECVHLNQTQERLEADLALSHEKLHTLHLEVRSRDQLILQLRAEMKSAEQKHQKTQEQVASLEGEIRNLKHKSRGQLEEASKLSEKVKEIQRLKDQTEKDQLQLQHRLCTSQQQLKGAQEELKDASLKKETVAIFKQKYTAAIAKVHTLQARLELLDEELQYSQRQLTESKSATHTVKEELEEMAQRYREKVGQWEKSQEALEQLMDELQATQNLLKENQQTVDHLKGLKTSKQEQMDKLKQQKLMLECDLHRYQQSHSHSDEEYLSLRRDRQLLRKHCTEQDECHAECDKAFLQMESELERQTQEKESLKQSLVASHQTHMSNSNQLEQEVMRLKKKVTHLELELSDNQKVHGALLRQSEEELKEARQEAARIRTKADAQSGELNTLKEKLQKMEEEMRGAIKEKQSLSGCIRRLSREMKELRGKYEVTVEELAARAEEASRMEGCLTEGKLAEEKIRSMAMKLELNVEELQRKLQQAVNQKLQAEREMQDAQDQVQISAIDQQKMNYPPRKKIKEFEMVEALRSEMDGTRSDNTNLRQESQLVMTNINCWITEQKASNQNLTAQMKAQNKVLLILTEEREHLQDANETLNAEVKRLKEVANEKERDVEHLKVKIQDQAIQKEKSTMEKHSDVALNLYKIEDMQTRLRSNLEAIRMLNQQLNALSQENKSLRRQLDEERSIRRKADYQCSSIQLPLSLKACPLPPSTIPSSLCRPPLLSLDTATRCIHTYSDLNRAGLERPGESQALDEVFRNRLTASLEDARSGRTSRDLIK